MPQMHWGGMSENWLLKELGDMHWVMISDGLDVESDKLMDSNGERLYSSFVRLRWESSTNLFTFKENQKISLDSKLSRYGNKMFFSDATVSLATNKINASLMSVFSSRTAEDNKTLKKGTPLLSETANIKTFSKLPNFAKEYLEIKSKLFSATGKLENITIELSEVIFELNSKPLYSQEYTIEPYDDINGVGLIYFASYSKISDKCERNYFHAQNKGKGQKDWAANSSCLARDIFYFGNANPDEELVYHLEICRLTGENRIQLGSSLYRKSDGQLIAKIFTIKEFSGLIHLGSSTKKAQQNPQETVPGIIQNPGKQENQVLSFQNKKTENSIHTKEKTGKIIVDFLSSMLDEENITELTDLKLLGIESVVYMELSEHLNTHFQIQSNPSRFYGLSTVKDIIAYLFNETVKDEKTKTDLPIEPAKNKPGTGSFDVAIIGTSFRVPGASSKEELWKLLLEGKSAISTLPEGRWIWPSWVDAHSSQKKINRGGFIKGIDEFDASFFSITPRDAEVMDPQQRLLLELTWELIEEAGYKASALKGSKTGVYIGASGSDYELLLRERNEQEALTGTGTSLAILANRLSYFYDFNGPSIQVDTACSSSLAAIHEAINSMKLGDCTQAIVGGIHLMCHPARTLSYHQSNMLSADGKCHTFDEKANGYVRSEGAVVMLLKPLAKAMEDGDTIEGIIKGSAINHGGQSGGLTVPNPEKQSELLEEAYRKAKISSSTVSYIEAHGTGTSLGDPIEITGLTKAFTNLHEPSGNQYPVSPWCGVGSVKTNLGHLEAAAGMAGILKVLLSMQHRHLPPTINFEKLNAKIELDGSPFYIQCESIPWRKEFPNEPLIAGISSFGIGGVNGHVIIESLPAAHKAIKKEQQKNKPCIFVLSAKNKGRLKAYAQLMIDHLTEDRSVDLAELAYTLQTAREEMEERLAFVFTSLKEISDTLHLYLNESPSPKLYTGNKKNGQHYAELSKDAPVIIRQWIEAGELENIARYWCNGLSLDWNLLYVEQRPEKIRPPNYPFSRERYWIPEAQQLKESFKTTVQQPGDSFVETMRSEKKYTTVFTELVKISRQQFNEKGGCSLLNVILTDSSRINDSPLKTDFILNEKGSFFKISTVKDSASPLYFGELSMTVRTSHNAFPIELKIQEARLTASEIEQAILNQKINQKNNTNFKLTSLHFKNNELFGWIDLNGKNTTHEPDIYPALVAFLWDLLPNHDYITTREFKFQNLLSPFFLESLTINKECTNNVFFQITRKDDECDIFIYNEDGTTCLSLLNFKGLDAHTLKEIKI
jgi:probable biosynthetic protein (TIGR04098 family)